MTTAIFQVTISGKDSGGYVWQNVFHVRGTLAAAVTTADFQALVTFVTDELIPPMAAAKADSNVMLNIGVKQVLPVATYTYNSPINQAGDRSGTENLGAVAGKITMYPVSGAITGRMFLNGCLDTDFEADVIVTAYQTLLDGVADALNLFDGSPLSYLWELGIYNKETSGFVVVDECASQQRPGVLSKRVRG